MPIALIFIKSHWRDFAIGSLAALVIVLFNRPAAGPVEVTSERVVYKDRVVDRVVYKDRIVTVDKVRTIVEPDGTRIVEETRATDKEVVKEQSRQEIVEVVQEKKTEVKSAPYRYSATASIKYNDPKAVNIDVGARLGELPVSAVVGYDAAHYEVRVGLRYDF